jgi:hypothetical protein
MGIDGKDVLGRVLPLQDLVLIRDGGVVMQGGARWQDVSWRL